MFFVFAAPIAAVTMVSFRNVMKNKNREFRQTDHLEDRPEHWSGTDRHGIEEQDGSRVLRVCGADRGSHDGDKKADHRQRELVIISLVQGDQYPHRMPPNNMIDVG